MQDHGSGRKDFKIVYTIVQRSGGRKFWLRIGAAFPNRDGSLNVQLDAVPTNGQLQIRDCRPRDETLPHADDDRRAHGDVAPRQLIAS